MIHLRPLLALFLFASLVLHAPAATTHVVRAGETLSDIAAAHGVSVRELARANRLRDADRLRKGQRLTIPSRPAAFITHKVAAGESLATIAKRYRVSVAEILSHNDLPDANHIRKGQRLKIPVAPGSTPVDPPPAPAAAGPSPAPSPAPAEGKLVLPASIQGAIQAAPVAAGRWRNIVIHHSGTREGSGRGMDRYHREERHMENGLAYRFVIGNGNGMTDGEIFIGRRWKEQLDGGHLAIPALNANSIGICLVGDFSKSRPTARQLQALESLCRSLMRRTGVTPENVTTHRLIHPRHTQCPGRLFPSESFRKRLARP